MTDQALAIRLREISVELISKGREYTEGPTARWWIERGLVLQEAADALTASEARQGALAQELEEARKDVMYHSDCRPNRRQAEAAAADAKALVDWRADVTVALQRPGGAHFADVPQHIRDLVQEVAALRAALDAASRRHHENYHTVYDEDVSLCKPNYEDCTDVNCVTDRALASPPPEDR